MAEGMSLSFSRAGEGDAAALVALRDQAARWQAARGIVQWRPGDMGLGHFLKRMELGEVWLARADRGALAGAWELWWDDPLTWGAQPPSAGYIHRLMVDRSAAPPGSGRVLLAAAERRIAESGRTLARLDCAASNARLRRYYTDAGYTEAGEQPLPRGSRYPVTLFEKRLREG
ncbi:GNAT family N-acetyltransferase [Sphaerisporangium aureirubrum]|uniref:GNAT family N-acetyltransferase n=1 Tax=Sphaerisporangium aureirubrum TaxID=1544736 RepID=A0ABW1NHQ4_9ACTN